MPIWVCRTAVTPRRPGGRMTGWRQNPTDFTNHSCRPNDHQPAACTLRPRAQRGLSRLEFAACVVVIAVLMSAFLHSLAPWRSRTREVQLQMALAAVRLADTRFQAACGQRTTGDCVQLVIDGESIAGAFGHPAASPDGIAALAGLVNPEWFLLPGSRDGMPALTVRVASAASNGCELVYVQAPRQGAAPAIHLVDSSCH